jgi:hypothetical protein
VTNGGVISEFELEGSVRGLIEVSIPVSALRD